jgi:hypothetical protein
MSRFLWILLLAVPLFGPVGADAVDGAVESLCQNGKAFATVAR